MSANSRPIKRRYSKRITLKEEKRRRRLTFAGIFAILLLAGGMLFYQSAKLDRERTQYEIQIQKLNDELDDAQALYAELNAKWIEVNSDRYIEEEARIRLGLVYDNEILIKRK